MAEARSRRRRRPPSRLETLSAFARVLSRFSPYLRPRAGRLALVALCTLLWIGVRLAEPWPLKVIIDGIFLDQPPPWVEALPGGRGAALAWLIGAVAALAVCGALLRYLQQTIATGIALEVASGMRRDLFAHILRLPVRFHQRRRAGDLVVRLMSDIRILRDAFATMPVRLLEELLLTAGMLVVMLLIDPPLTLVALLLPAFLLLTLRRFRAPIRAAIRQQRERESVVATTAGQALSAMRLVQGYGQESAEVRRFGKAARKDLRSGLASARLEGRMTAVIELGVGVAMGLIVGAAALRIRSGALTPGDLIVFASYLSSFYTPLRRMARTMKRLARAAEAGRRVREILDEEAGSAEAPAAPIPLPRLRGAIRFEEVTVAHGRRPLLDRVSFEVAAGESLAVLGATGAGKSTLVGLIPRLQDPTEGRLLLDGRDAREIPLGVLRAQVALVFQDPMLFAGSIADNIALGRPEAGRAAIAEAARVAGVAPLIERLPRGYDTPVGELGTLLSGGQRRCVAVARAVLLDAPIVILDEPTVGLDPAATAEVSAAVAALGRGRTVILVTHDIATIPDDRRVILLAEGRVVADGPKRALVASGALAPPRLSERTA